MDSAGVDSTASVPAVGTADFRSRLIVALKEVRGEAASKDSSVVARMFRFPFPDSAIRISGDSNFEKVKDHGNVSRELSFTGIASSCRSCNWRSLGPVFGTWISISLERRTASFLMKKIVRSVVFGGMASG